MDMSRKTLAWANKEVETFRNCCWTTSMVVWLNGSGQRLLPSVGFGRESSSSGCWRSPYCAPPQTRKLGSMASFEEDFDGAVKLACLALSVENCKELQKICLQHLLRKKDVLFCMDTAAASRA